MKVRNSLFFLISFFCIYSLGNYANAEYREVLTFQGKVIIGLDKEKALDKFGVPASASQDVWSYFSPNKFFVYFAPDSLLDIYLYPQFCQVTVGVPVEFKAFGYFSDLTIKDITAKAQFLIKEAGDFVVNKPGVFIPKRDGEYRLLVQYQDILSNPAQLTITKKPQEGGTQPETEKCLSINVLPYKPIVKPQTIVDFTALGTFLSPSGDQYFVRDISKEVDWFIKKDTEISPAKDNKIQFSSSGGKMTVFCKYKGLESFPQEVEVDNNYTQFQPVLKHIILLPEFVFIAPPKEIDLRAFGTYHDNIVSEVTSKVRWKISDRETISSLGNNKFLAASEGVSDITVEFDDIKSLPAKIIVFTKEETISTASSGASAKSPASSSPPESTIPPEALVAPLVYAKPEIKKIYSKDSQDLIRDIKKDTEKVSKKVLEEEKKLKAIKIIPDHITIPLGEERQLVALGIYNDNSQEDLTLLGDWLTSDYKIFVVSKGGIYTRMLGEATVTVKYKGISSLPAKVIVEKPGLVSIVVSPLDSKISMRDKLNFQAEGIFSDSSRRDITLYVSWEVSNPKVLKIEQVIAVARPLRIGQSEVYAKYLEIKSLPASVKVIVTVNWLIYRIIRIIFFLIFGMIMLFAMLYFITENKKNKFKSALEKNPKEFMVKIYKNAKEVLLLFGFKHKGFLPPLSYAKLVDANYSVRRDYYEILGVKNNATADEIKSAYHKLAIQYHPDRVSRQEKEKATEKFNKISEAYNVLSDLKARNAFLMFTVKFEEAAYSQHILKPQDALLALGDYNNFLKMLLSRYNKFDALLKYCLALLHTRPFFYI